MTEDEMIQDILAIFPNATLGEDEEGQLIIHTGCQVTEDVEVPRLTSFEN